MSALKVKFAAEVLRAGGVIAYPTEAVWGLGCDPGNSAAVLRLLALKQRDPAKGLILVAADIAQFSPYLKGLPEQQLSRLSNAWPGPYTFIVPDNGYAPPLIKGHFSSVALRVSANKQVADLCRAFGGPIVSTSANLAGQPTPKWPWLVQQQLGQGFDFILPGCLGRSAKPSEIRDLITDKVIRSG